jgi:hypothetical protein
MSSCLIKGEVSYELTPKLLIDVLSLVDEDSSELTDEARGI